MENAETDMGELAKEHCTCTSGRNGETSKCGPVSFKHTSYLNGSWESDGRRC